MANAKATTLDNGLFMTMWNKWLLKKKYCRLKIAEIKVKLSTKSRRMCSSPRLVFLY